MVTLGLQKRRLKLSHSRPVVIAGGTSIMVLSSLLYFIFCFFSFDKMYFEKLISEPQAMETWRDQQATKKWGLSERQTQILEQAETFEIFSLFPLRLSKQLAVKRVKEHFPTADIQEMTVFRGFPSVGRTQVVLSSEREMLLGSLYMSMARPTFKGRCFEPRHGIRASTEDGLVIDLVICFTCSRMEVYENDSRTDSKISPIGKASFDDYFSFAGLLVY